MLEKEKQALETNDNLREELEAYKKNQGKLDHAKHGHNFTPKEQIKKKRK